MNIKKTIISLILLLSILMLCSCEEAKAPETPEPFEEKEFTKYDVYRDGDVYYIVSDGRTKNNPYDKFISGHPDKYCLRNDSYEGLRNAVYSENLSPDYMMWCYLYFQAYTIDGVKTDGRIISELKYAPVVPDGLEETGAFMYRDTRYEIDYNGNNGEKITWIYYPEKAYKTRLDVYTSYFNDKKIVETSNLAEGETVYIYQYKDSDLIREDNSWHVEEKWSSDQKIVRYILQAEGKTFAVEEIYQKVDDTVPQELHMYSIEGEGYKVEIRNMTERPAKEWLLSFGIEEAPRDVYKNVIVVE